MPASNSLNNDLSSLAIDGTPTPNKHSNSSTKTNKNNHTTTANATAVSTTKYIGSYSPDERYKRLLKFFLKRNRRVWTKKVKYDVRKNFADSRVRVKGRFVRKEDEEFLMKELTDRQSIEDGGSVGGGDEGKIRSGGGRNTPLNMISSTSGTVVTSPQRHVAAALMSLTNSST